jgi:transposase-like protein
MTRQHYPETFKIEAVKQVTERARPVADVAQALGISSHNLYVWLNSNSAINLQSSSTKSLPCKPRYAA